MAYSCIQTDLPYYRLVNGKCCFHLIAAFPFLFGQAFDYYLVGISYKFAYFPVGYVLVEIDADPIFFIHMPTGFNTCVVGLQLFLYCVVGFYLPTIFVLLLHGLSVSRPLPESHCNRHYIDSPNPSYDIAAIPTTRPHH